VLKLEREYRLGAEGQLRTKGTGFYRKHGQIILMS